MSGVRPESELELPSWMEELDSSLRFHSQFVLVGNVRDVFVVPSLGAGPRLTLIDAVWHLLKRRGCTYLAAFDPVDRLSLRHRDNEATLPASNDLGSFDVSGRANITDPQLRGWVRAVQMPSGSHTSGALVIDFASRLARPMAGPNSDLDALFNLAEKVSYSARRATPRQADGLALSYNPVIWLVDNASDLPDSFRVGNDRVRTVLVGLPDRAARTFIADNLVVSLRRRMAIDDELASRFSQQFVLLTEGMKLSSIFQINDMLATSFSDVVPGGAGTGELDPVRVFASAIRAYRVGSTRDPWRDPTVLLSIRGGRDEIAKEVKGQDFAVETALDILKRSVTGLSGAQAGRSVGRPRGVLFFAGPTGVGKTELAKQITRVLFGDVGAYHRFDMSEFSQEHSEARLIGAPPGYIGHDSGGQLVNAIRARPFSVLLFDEIEKAHPRILDKFLQILEDGRLTDGRGDTVYFSEAVIIFTSNLGIYRETTQDGRTVRIVNVTAETAPTRADVERVVLEEISEFFRFRIQRPELLNRIGKNILVFDFVRDGVAREIMEKMLGNLRQRVLEEHRVTLSLSNSALSTLERLCIAEAAVNGGRGIGNCIEKTLINPLGRAMFDALPLDAGSRLCVEDIKETSGRWELRLAGT